MTTKTNITLPPLPQPRIMPQDHDTNLAHGYSIDDMAAYARAAVEADRQDRTAKPLPELIVTKGGIPFEDQNEGIRQFKEACMAAAAIEADRQDHVRDATKMVDQSGAVNEMVPSDEAIQVLAKQYDCHYAPGFMGFARALLSRYGQPAASAEPECSHCGGTGDVSGEYPGVACSDCCGTGKSAPVAQEPTDSLGIPLSCGMPLCSPGRHHPLCKHAAPVAAQAHPANPILPYEQALSELIDKIVPGLDTGDVLADARQASAALGMGGPVAQEPVAIPWRDVNRAIIAVHSEAKRRGEMFPQTADERADDRKAVIRVVGMIEWYATKGGYVAENLPDWPIYAVPVAAQAQHPDDAAVDRFAAAMKTKLAQKRAEGRGGWEDKAQCSQDRLSLMLRGHVAKGDPVDVGNFCMMLHQRGERISDRDAASPSVQDRTDAQRYRYLRDVGSGFDVSVREDGDEGENWVAGYPPSELDAAIDAARAAKGADHA